MPRNGAGSYSPPSNTWNPAVPEVPILSDDWNATLADLALALTQSMATDGQSTFSARIPFAQGLTLSNGSVSAPSVSAISDTDTGLYFPAAGQIAVAANGTQVMSATSTGVTFPLAVTFTGNQSVTGTFTVAGATTLNGAVVLGDAVGDTITVNGTTTFVGPVTVPDASFTNAKLANVPTATFKGRTTAGTGVPEDLTGTQATALLSVVVGDSGSGGTKGLVPAAAAGDAAKKLYLDAAGGYSNEVKAWGVFTGSTGATVAARNITCVRNGAGDFTFTFGTALANSDYFFNVFIRENTSTDGTYQPFTTTKSASAFRINVVKNAAGSVTSFDPAEINVQVIA